MGEIVDRVREYIPATFMALTQASYFGVAGMERVTATTKFRLFATVVLPEQEDQVYDPFTLDYAAKVATLRVIPAGADYWSDQLTGETTNEETLSFPDRIDSLWKIHEQLLGEVRADAAYFEELWPGTSRRSAEVPRVTTQELQTAEPVLFGKSSSKVRFGQQSSVWDDIPWTGWG